mgnify:CR=1 FL=1
MTPGQIVAALDGVVAATPANAPTPLWTANIFRALADLAGPNQCVDPPSLTSSGTYRRKGEFLWDLVISEYPRYNAPVPYEYPGYFDAVVSAELALVGSNSNTRPKRARKPAVSSQFSPLIS